MINLTDMKFSIEDNLFDSGLIAQKVGKLVIQNYKSVSPDKGRSIADHARKNKYNLVVLETEGPVNLESFLHVGVLYEVEAAVYDVWSNVVNIPSMFTTRELNDTDWEQILELLDLYYPSTRYSKDPKITHKQVIDHKSAILKDLMKKYPAYSLGIFSRENKLIGFHFLRQHSDDFIFLQELLVKPDYRIGFASLQLVKENLYTVMKNTSVKCLVTRFYDDNKASVNFFTKLGFKKLRKKEYYYHMWV